VAAMWRTEEPGNRGRCVLEVVDGPSRATGEARRPLTRGVGRPTRSSGTPTRRTGQPGRRVDGPHGDRGATRDGRAEVMATRPGNRWKRNGSRGRPSRATGEGEPTHVEGRIRATGDTTRRLMGSSRSAGDESSAGGWSGPGNRRAKRTTADTTVRRVTEEPTWRTGQVEPGNRNDGGPQRELSRRG